MPKSKLQSIKLPEGGVVGGIKRKMTYLDFFVVGIWGLYPAAGARQADYT